MITNVNDIDNTTHEGRLLIAALSIITTEYRTDKTPDEVLQEINELADLIDEECGKFTTSSKPRS